MGAKLRSRNAAVGQTPKRLSYASGCREYQDGQRDTCCVDPAVCPYCVPRGQQRRACSPRQRTCRPEDRVVELYPATHPRLDHGYAVTSHSSQGQIADRVLMRPSLRSFIVNSMNSRNRHRVLAQIHLRKKRRRTPAPRAQGTCSSQIDSNCTIALHNFYTATIYGVMLI